MRHLCFLALLFVAGCDCGDDDDPVDAGLDAAPDVPGSGSVEVPASFELPLGQRTDLTLRIAGGPAGWQTFVAVQAPLHVFVNGQPGGGDPLTIGEFEVGAASQIATTIELQAIVARDFTVTVVAGDEFHDVAVHVLPTPTYFGLTGASCTGPFDLVWGPACGACGAETTDEDCAAGEDPLTCHPVEHRQRAEGDGAARTACGAAGAFPSQVTSAVPADWATLAIDQGLVEFTQLDWVTAVLAEEGLGHPVLVPGLSTWWLEHCEQCENANGSIGPYDPLNDFVMDAVADFYTELATHTAGQALAIASSRDPAGPELLCPCLASGAPCEATAGPDQPACTLGPGSDDFADTYGAVLSALHARFATAVRTAAPSALVITGALDDPNEPVSPTSRLALATGETIDALGIQRRPAPEPTWLDPLPDCAASPAPAGCETAPPFTDWVVTTDVEGVPTTTTMRAREVWAAMDAAADPSELLEDLALLELPAIGLWDQGLHAGFAGSDPAETIAAYRFAAISAFTGVLGTELTHEPSDADAWVQLLRSFSGAAGVHTEQFPRLGTDYTGGVALPLNRGDEDLLVIWSNDPALTTVHIDAEDRDFESVEVVRVQAAAELQLQREAPSTPEGDFPIVPLREVLIVSVRTNAPRLVWLRSLTF